LHWNDDDFDVLADAVTGTIPNIEALALSSTPSAVGRGSTIRIKDDRLVNERISKCVPGAQQVVFPGLVHNAPSVDPAAFTAVLFEFISKRQSL
jgi:hypothetical protein